MKFKYRRYILFSCMLMMFVGMVIMTVSKPKNEEKNISALSEETENRAMTQPLEKDKHPKINDLVRNYHNAEVNNDLNALELYVNDINNYSFEDLQKKFAYVEYFDNISCYTIEACEEDSYVLYVYREYKMTGIDTLIPSVVQNYVCKNESGQFVIYSGDVSDETNEFIKATEKNPSVLELVDLVNNKIEQIKKEDEAVKVLIEQLDEAGTKNVSQE